MKSKKNQISNFTLVCEEEISNKKKTKPSTSVQDLRKVKPTTTTKNNSVTRTGSSGYKPLEFKNEISPTTPTKPTISKSQKIKTEKNIHNNPLKKSNHNHNNSHSNEFDNPSGNGSQSIIIDSSMELKNSSRSHEQFQKKNVIQTSPEPIIPPHNLLDFSIKPSTTSSPPSLKPFTPFYVHDLTVPTTASLFAFSPVSFSISSKDESMPSKDLSFAFVDTNPIISNGQLQRTCVPENGLLFKMLSSDKLFLMIELLQKKTNRAEFPTPVTFCSGKCSKRKSQVIETAVNSFCTDNEGNVSLAVGINEQCAHKSECSYGSPKTLFYLSVSILQFYPKENYYMELSNCTSSFIKIVAPGKAKDSTNEAKKFHQNVKKAKLEKEGRGTKKNNNTTTNSTKNRSRSISPVPESNRSPLPMPSSSPHSFFFPNEKSNFQSFPSNQQIWDRLDKIEERLSQWEHFFSSFNNNNMPIPPSTPGRNILTGSQEVPLLDLYSQEKNNIINSNSNNNNNNNNKDNQKDQNNSGLIDLSEVAHNLSQEEEKVKFSQDSQSLPKDFRISGFFANSQTQNSQE